MRILLCILATILISTQAAKADDEKVFFTTVIYGTVAGALIGVATLAFTNDPGGNLMNIARGASLGLYAGILLGAYLYYSGDESSPSGTTSPEGVPAEAPQGSLLHRIEKDSIRHFAVYPLIQQGSVGVGSTLLTVRF